MNVTKVWRKSCAVQARLTIGVAGFFLLLASLVSCDDKVALSQYLPVSEEGWNMNDTLNFRVDSLEKGGTYVLTLALRTASASAYPYNKLQLVVENQWYDFPTHSNGLDGKNDSLNVKGESSYTNKENTQAQENTLHQQGDVANSYGDTLTSQGVTLFSSKVPVLTRIDTMDLDLVDAAGNILGVGVSNYLYRWPADTITLPDNVCGVVKVFHRMRRPTLPGIMDVGVELERIVE